MNNLDVQSIDSILRALYESVSFHPPAEPDWERLKSLFSPNARIVPPQPPSQAVFPSELTVEEYIERYKINLASGDLRVRGFTEAEFGRRIERFGNVAHAFSTYFARHLPEDAQPFIRGINSIQLIYFRERWWVLSLAWDDERTMPIPFEYLDNRFSNRDDTTTTRRENV